MSEHQLSLLRLVRGLMLSDDLGDVWRDLKEEAERAGIKLADYHNEDGALSHEKLEAVIGPIVH